MVLHDKKKKKPKAAFNLAFLKRIKILNQPDLQGSHFPNEKK